MFLPIDEGIFFEIPLDSNLNLSYWEWYYAKTEKLTVRKVPPDVWLFG
ncbi:hypothetical protein CDL12_03662 [Handroanthus impetiginosus]|uniref:Uncharacterized protein n=1 Tax=Handroanthus impetiginosus TaxID=429701 RepID=A0A2G9I1H6_9LAMI|nr:hypothetical protein CDL12_03662 [Handroanthus impetiginosus]